MTDPFALDIYLVRRKVLKLFGGAFHIYDPSGNLVLFCEMKAFKLKEDLRIYSGEDKSREVLAIRARRAIDFSATYDVVDSTTGAAVGALQRKGMKSIIRDEWEILDPAGAVIAVMQEDSTALALLRRFLTNLVPQSFVVTSNGMPIGELKQNFNPFVLKLNVDLSRDTAHLLDRRLAIAGAILLAGIEGRQG